MANREEKFFKTKLQSIPKTNLDIKEIRHLILILSRNSFEAMSKGGTLSITTRKEGPYVVLEIEDNGKGIDPIVLEKIGTLFLPPKKRERV
jgi:signal transduction histidine kinase